MVDVTISLIGSNGDEIELADDGDFVLASGVTGFGIPATSVRIDESANAGGVWRFSKRGVRDIDLPIVIMGTTRADVETKLRRMARLLQDGKGATKIVANYSDNTSVYLNAHYVGGAETQFGSDATSFFCRWVVQMQAPQPFWESEQTESFSITTGNTGRGMLPELTKLKLTSSQTLGVVEVDNVGDVTIQPIWTIRGPVNELVISNGTQSFGISTPIALGSTITIDTGKGTVVDDAGTNLYSLLNPAPKLFGLPPGTTGVSVNGVDATPATQITCFYSPRYEVVH